MFNTLKQAGWPVNRPASPCAKSNCYPIGHSLRSNFALGIGGEVRYIVGMKADASVIEIPTSVLDSVDTLDELEDWLMAKNRRVMRELRQARQDDLAGKFKACREHAASAARRNAG
jgi:hypothetical protein